MRIGVFDSGVGGATVLAEALRMLPAEDYLYYADTLHVPYGEKSKEAVRGYIFEGVERMLQMGMKALVIACNTATSIAAAELRERYSFPIIGMEPAVKPAVLRNADGEKRVLVLATRLTLKENKFKQLVSAVDQRHIVDFLALPGLVELAEQGIFSGAEPFRYLEQQLAQFDLSHYGTVVLGCTHFPLFESELRRLLPLGTDIIDGAEGTVKHLISTLNQQGLLGGGSGNVLFQASGNEGASKIVFEAALANARSFVR
ncbi:MAG: glutamate racemase [Paenibacillaceae bacterium]|jgi:glutamate racemase|nr:glutamate racemase [Paenibacillaceae bacterium]